MNLSALSLSLFLSGAIFLGYLVIALFFIRFWRRTGERLFALFAAAFILFALERIILVCIRLENNPSPVVYLTRLVGFALIVAAIVDKNRRAGTTR